MRDDCLYSCKLKVKGQIHKYKHQPCIGKTCYGKISSYQSSLLSTKVQRGGGENRGGRAGGGRRDGGRERRRSRKKERETGLEGRRRGEGDGAAGRETGLE